MIEHPAPITGATRTAIVIGDPVRHSLSPQIHNAAFAALGLDWRYLAMPVKAGRGADGIRAMLTLGIDGCSVTMPHKEVAAETVDRLMPAARALGSVNCVRREGTELVGDSTDGIGFVRALEAAIDRPVSDATVGILGAGGAARSIIDAVARAGASRITVANRSADAAERAVAIAAVAHIGDAAEVAMCDIVVNTTSVGMLGGPDPEGSPIDADLLRADHIVADIVYQPRQTTLLAAAAERGALTVGGVGMLVHQAAVAFEWWTGEPAPIDVMTGVAAP